MKRIYMSAMALTTACIISLPSYSQGVIVHKTNGTKITVPYSELDCITTYTEEDENQDEPDISYQGFNIFGSEFRMILVKGGTFDMGATPEQYNGYTPFGNEKPVHSVTLDDFYICDIEVTQELWYAVMGKKPCSHASWSSQYGLGDKYPAYNISYSECQTFINILNAMTEFNFRLPTEAEWEYAARGGNKSKGYIFSGSNIIDDVAWYYSNSNKTHPVAQKEPNELGLYDMSGNVWEWCADWYGIDYYSKSPQNNPTGPSTGSGRVIRGGSWSNSASFSRLPSRSCDTPSNHLNFIGLRLAMDIPKQQSQSDLYYDDSSNEIVYGEHRYKMVEVPGGTFTMGATQEQGSDADTDEKPTHEVTLSTYSIGATEVPQWLWVAVMGDYSNSPKGENMPVECLNWGDCQNFINKLNDKIGKNFRLPTEAEWEYAARGGRSGGPKYAGSDNVNDVAWFKDNSGNYAHEVGTKCPNSLGLYDMSGNVFEWCSDWYEQAYYSNSPNTNPTGPTSGSRRVLRGGSWLLESNECRVANRYHLIPEYWDDDLGMRLAL